ncbi:MAG: hypothetical protein DMG57_19385 [Acidobacteria bacterium]|nr:MAG: hypothetical protein DMG57_19385 [Acidobacteriota bacterium]
MIGTIRRECLGSRPRDRFQRSLAVPPGEVVRDVLSPIQSPTLKSSAANGARCR